ncbi:type I-E CRISPR-associated protein Cas7/Cse4/CasC [Streptomyces albidoflavus]|uniref:type I-E CRISPR-associated protein Cas7/Cse4/CasC n=1 Tax=Streptomyces albidoflavus TaxID=1886 RepID=UPI0033BBB88C
MKRCIVDIHILQNVPPSNMNRDDTGTPKSAYYGGERRARVSSQAWKKATRERFQQLLPPEELGVRTKRVVEALAERITERDATVADNAVKLAEEVLSVATGSKLEVPKRKAKGDDGSDRATLPESKYLMFLSRRQLDALADIAVVESDGGDPAILKAELKDKKKKVGARARAAIDTRHSVDIALFGRMVADAADLNVEAAAQVAHALSVHRSELESDYYTAVDDLSGDSESGAGMIGTIDFNSSTLYRYAAVDVDELHRNLGVGLDPEQSPSVPAAKALTSFLEAFITSLPTGKINTFAHHTRPSVVVVKLRERWPLSFVGAFETPVPRSESGGFLRQSCEQLTTHMTEMERAYGLDSDPTWVFRVGKETESLAGLGGALTLDALLGQVGSAVAERLESGA